MDYEYTDFAWDRKTVRVIRINGGKGTPGGSFFDGDDVPEPSHTITTYDVYYLDKLREQTETENRLAYFDIDGDYVKNSPGLEGFQYDDDADNLIWISATVKL